MSDKVENLINLWSNSMPNMQTDPPCTWDDVITNRCIYFEFIEDKYFSVSNLDQSTSFNITKYDEDEELLSINKNIKKA